jgi:GNAT superfamily N-acetyltransferase
MTPRTITDHVLDWVALIEKLGEVDRDSLLAHFVLLEAEDRRLRFGLSVSDEHIERYVGGIDFEVAHMYGVRASPNEWLGIGHFNIDPNGGPAELGLSVLPAARGRGLGSAIFRSAVAQASRLGATRLYMHFLTTNKAILSIARSAGMSIESGGGESDAYLIVPEPSELVRMLIREPQIAA